MVKTLSAELRLIAACARWPSSSHRTEAIRATTTERIDWARCMLLAQRHQVVGLVDEGLKRVPSQVPGKVLQEIAELASVAVRVNLAITRESLRLQHLFDDAGLAVFFIKGPTLSILAFDNVGIRSSQDIDLLVELQTLGKAVAVLLEAGYRRYDPPAKIDVELLEALQSIRKDFGFIHDETGLQVELHWRLFLNPYAMLGASGTSLFMAASRIVPVTPANGLRTFGEEDLFSYLCMHGALHWWCRLKWLADVNALIAADHGHAVEGLYRAAEDRGVGRAALQAFWLCRNILGARLPTDFDRTVGRRFLVKYLETTALKAVIAEAAPHDRRFGTTRGSLSALLLNGDWRYFLFELKGLLTSQTDMLAVPLPKPLWFLYPLLRLPLWVWRHLKPR